MIETIIANLDLLLEHQKLDKTIIIWGINNHTKAIIEWMDTNHYGSNLELIVGNYTAVYCKEFNGIPVKEPKALRSFDPDVICILFSINYSDAVLRQASAYGICEAYNLSDLSVEIILLYRCHIPYTFIDRSKGKNTCVIC